MSKAVIDVSQFNTVTSWPTVAKNVDGVIVRAGYRGYGSGGTLCTDSEFKANLTGAISAGIPVGVYFVTQAVTEAEAIEEANFACDLIKPYRISLPVYWDTEYSSSPNHTGRADKLSAAVRTACALAFCARVKALGYTPGIYASESWFGSQMQRARLSGYTIWCAKYSTVKPSIGCDAWQYTSTGTVPGIAGAVDVSHFYKDFVREVKTVTPTEAKKIIMEKAGLSAATIVYLDSYKYADDLLVKLATALKG